jgi:hypothetical protein
MKVHQEGDLQGYGTVYYHPDVAANILSIYKLTIRFQSVVCDNKKKDAFIVTSIDGSNTEFLSNARMNKRRNQKR